MNYLKLLFPFSLQICLYSFPRHLLKVNPYFSKILKGKPVDVESESEQQGGRDPVRLALSSSRSLSLKLGNWSFVRYHTSEGLRSPFPSSKALDTSEVGPVGPAQRSVPLPLEIASVGTLLSCSCFSPSTSVFCNSSKFHRQVWSPQPGSPGHM